jgi:hypothetical protein
MYTIVEWDPEDLIMDESRSHTLSHCVSIIDLGGEG